MLNNFSTNRGRAIVAVLVVAVVMAASAGSVRATTPPATGTPPPYAPDDRQVIVSEPPIGNPDEEMATVTREVPGFGGAHVRGDAAVGESETLVIWLRKPGSAAARQAQEALARRLGNRFDQDRIEVRAADYDFVELKAWHDTLTGAFAATEAVFTDIDETKNRVLVGVPDPAADAGAVESFAIRHGVPAEAIVFIQATAVEPTLRSSHRPMRGGLQIQFQTGGLAGTETSQCTLGYPAVRSGVAGFITNSHCSKTTGSVDDSRYWQASRPLLGGSQVGTEEVDPPFFSGSSCPWDGLVCRHSDSNFVRAHDASHIVPGTIARIGTTSTDWNGSSLWRVTATQEAALDVVVTKVGRTTGLTSGRITATCVNNLHANTNKVILCNAHADMYVDHGDSGAPAFRVTNSPSTHDVASLGIVWGKGTRENGIDFSSFSRIASVKSELASPRICAAGFSC